MTVDNTEDYSRNLPEYLENSPWEMTTGQKFWFFCWILIIFMSLSVGLIIPGLIGLCIVPLGIKTHDGVIYERMANFPKNFRNERSSQPFFDPPDTEEVLSPNTKAEGKTAKKKYKRKDLRTPFKTTPSGIVIPQFGSVPRGIMHNSTRGTDRFYVTVRSWSAANHDLAERSADEADLSEALKEALSELDGGIRFRFVSGSRPRNIYNYTQTRYAASRVVLIEALESGEAESQVIADDANLLDELLVAEKTVCVDPITVFVFEVPRPAYWAKALKERGYLTETDIEVSPLAAVMVAAYEGLERAGMKGIEVLDMPAMLSRVRSNLDIGGIDKFHRALHFAGLRHEGDAISWHDLFKDQSLWPRKIPKVGKDFIITDQTIHRIFRMYRFRLNRVLPGFLDTLHTFQSHRYWFTFVYDGRTGSVSYENRWLTRQIVTREGIRRVFRSGDRHETLQEQEHRELPKQRQDDLYLSRGPAIKSNKYMIISVPLPELLDDMDEDERLQVGLETMRLAENRYRSRGRRLRIISRPVKGLQQIEVLSDTLT